MPAERGWLEVSEALAAQECECEPSETTCERCAAVDTLKVLRRQNEALFEALEGLMWRFEQGEPCAPDIQQARSALAAARGGDK